MTERELDLIMAENLGHKGVAKLRENIEELSDKLSDCWLLLDEVARTPGPHGSKAAMLLIKQKVPGWKGKE